MFWNKWETTFSFCSVLPVMANLWLSNDLTICPNQGSPTWYPEPCGTPHWLPRVPVGFVVCIKLKKKKKKRRVKNCFAHFESVTLVHFVIYLLNWAFFLISITTCNYFLYLFFFFITLIQQYVFIVCYIFEWLLSFFFVFFFCQMVETFKSQIYEEQKWWCHSPAHRPFLDTAPFFLRFFFALNPLLKQGVKVTLGGVYFN